MHLTAACQKQGRHLRISSRDQMQRSEQSQGRRSTFETLYAAFPLRVESESGQG